MNLCKRGMSTREVILIKIKNKTKTLNEFLNIKNIEDNYLTTLDGQVILFIKIFLNKINKSFENFEALIYTA